MRSDLQSCNKKGPPTRALFNCAAPVAAGASTDYFMSIEMNSDCNSLEEKAEATHGINGDGETVTVLFSAGPVMTKTWKADGTIEPYSRAWQVEPKERPVAGLRELAALLNELSQDPRCCIIRGKFIGHEAVAKSGALDDIKRERAAAGKVDRLRAGFVPRKGQLFEDRPQHAIMLDVDGFRPVLWNSVNEAEDACLEFVKHALPEEFQGVSFYWALSGSAGHPSAEGKLKAHIWFWLEQPYTSAQLRAWADGISDIDRTIYQPVQVHYIAQPQFDEGVPDPVEVRSGLYVGPRGDIAALQIGSVVLARAKEAKTGYAPMSDPEEKPGLIGAFNRVFGPKDLAELMPDEFMHGRDDTHFTLIGHAADGVYITACGRGLVNGYNSAPDGAERRQCMFDFARLHMFGSLDDGIADDIPINQRPSHRAMLDYIKQQYPEVEEERARFEHEAATGDFQDLDEAGRVAAISKGTAQATPLVECEHERAVDVASTPAPSKGLPALIDALSSPKIAGRMLAFDSFAGRLMWANPGSSAPQWAQFTDSDYTRLRDRLERHHGFKKIGREDLRDAAGLVAETNAIDTAQVWLGSLEWDGTLRVETSIERFFGAPPGNYARAIARYLWTALAGRVLQPGLKVDMVPIAVGKQGGGKSSTIAALVPDQRFFAEVDLARRDDDTKRQVQGKLVVELPELRGFSSRDADSLKAFISSQEDEWVEKYQSLSRKRPRRFVFFGSTNRQDFLGDETGNRRFLPFMASTCDPTALARERDQLWAEAAVMFKRGGLDFEEAERLAREEHDGFIETDALDDQVRQYLDSSPPLDFGNLDESEGADLLQLSVPSRREFVTLLDVMTGPMGWSAANCNKAMQRRASQIMRRLGWEPCQKKIDGRTCSGWKRTP
jgi:hypothetical protein